MGIVADFGSLGKDILGSSDSKRGFTETEQFRTARTDISGTATEQLQLDPAAITRIIEEVLSGPEGLAAIFQGEQTAGIFDSTVSAQAAGNLTAKLVGELAKITGKTVSTQDQTQFENEEIRGSQLSTEKTSSSGLLKDSGLASTFEKLPGQVGKSIKEINKEQPGGSREGTIPNSLPGLPEIAAPADASANTIAGAINAASGKLSAAEQQAEGSLTPGFIADAEESVNSFEAGAEQNVADRLLSILGLI